MEYSERQTRSKHRSWSEDEDPGVVSEIEDEMLEEIGPVTPVLTPTHSTEDILDMFDKTGEKENRECYVMRTLSANYHTSLHFFLG